MRIGVDLGGTKIEAVVLDPQDKIIVRQRVPTPAGDYAGTVRAIAGLVLGIETSLGIAAPVGIGTPGTVSGKTGLMINCNSTVLNGKPLLHDLQALLGRAVKMENDANCLALSEAADGAAAGAETVFAAILGTGVGGGLVIDGKLRSGSGHIAGEWGHNPLPWMTKEEWPGQTCWCGRVGCIETFLNGAALSRDYLSRTGLQLDAAEIARLVDQDSAEAMAILAAYRNRLARALAHIVNILDPDVVVLGGGLSNIEALYTGLANQIRVWIFSDQVSTKIVRARHGDSSGVLGAARLTH